MLAPAAVALVLVTSLPGPPPTDPELSSGLRAERLYVASGRPLNVIVDVPGEAELTLVLIDADGTTVGRTEVVGRGRVDVAALCPAVWELRRAAYLQCLADGTPADSPLVVQPMIEQDPPRTEEARRPDGTRYTRISGWGPSSGESPDDPPVFSGIRVYPDRDVMLMTTEGEIVLAMRPDEAPNTVWNFLRLVEGGFYDGLTFHRIVPLTRHNDPFVIQAGDPTGTGDGGPGYRLPIEPSALAHDFGVISMARADHPDSAGSQFFICLSRRGTARLDGQYCAFGEAVVGAETIRAIAAVELADVAAGRAVQPPVIRHARLIPSPPRRPGVGRPDRPLAELEEPPSADPGPDRVPR